MKLSDVLDLPELGSAHTQGRGSRHPVSALGSGTLAPIYTGRHSAFQRSPARASCQRSQSQPRRGEIKTAAKALDAFPHLHFQIRYCFMFTLIRFRSAAASRLHGQVCGPRNSADRFLVYGTHSQSRRGAGITAAQTLVVIIWNKLVFAETVSKPG